MPRGRRRGANAGRGRGGASANPELQAAVAAEFERLMPGMLQNLVSSIRDELEDVISASRGRGRGRGRGSGGRGRGRGRGQPANEEENEAEAEAEAEAEDDGAVSVNGCSFQQFKRCDPPKLAGTENAAAVLQWITTMDRVVKISECRPDQAVRYVAHCLIDEAMSWWLNEEIIRTEAERDALRWEDMKEMIQRQFCPEAEVEKAEIALASLKAAGKTHREYTTEFNRLSRLATTVVRTDADRLKYYLRGLTPTVRAMVRSTQPATFEAAVQRTNLVYSDLEIEKAPEEVDKVAKVEKSIGESKESFISMGTWKRLGDQTWVASAKKARVEGKKSEPEPKQSLGCSKCGRAHGGECRVGSSGCYKCGKPGHLASACNFPNTCFNCGQPGHVARACPKERKVVASSSKTDGRAFTITKEQAE